MNTKGWLWWVVGVLCQTLAVFLYIRHTQQEDHSSVILPLIILVCGTLIYRSPQVWGRRTLLGIGMALAGTAVWVLWWHAYIAWGVGGVLVAVGLFLLPLTLVHMLIYFATTTAGTIFSLRYLAVQPQFTVYAPPTESELTVRREMAEKVHQLFSGTISNLEFDDFFSENEMKLDAGAFAIIFSGVFTHYDDFTEHPMPTERATIEQMNRIILFMSTSLVYQKKYFRAVNARNRLFRLLCLKSRVQHIEEYWPFDSPAQYETTKAAMPDVVKIVHE